MPRATKVDPYLKINLQEPNIQERRQQARGC